MGLSRRDAYHVLDCPNGASAEMVRDNYTRLATKYHPDKHKNPERANKIFKSINIAYKRITHPDLDSDDEIDMSNNEMFKLYKSALMPSANSNGYADSSDSDESDDYDEDDDDDDDDDSKEDFPNLLVNRIRAKHSGRQGRKEAAGAGSQLTPEEIERNAQELITEEEKEKRKAEKRRAKKKRRREKKKLEKQAKKVDNPGSKSGLNDDSKKSKKGRGRGSDSSGSEAENFDETAAFFTKVVSKKKKQATGGGDGSSGKSKKAQNGKEDEEELDQVVLRSRQLAIRGNQMANQGEYSAAIDLFSEAIKLDSKDFRFFGNRSYCYDRMQQYEKALKDADKAINLDSEWPKGYFRKGRALAGLKLNAEAEQAFMQVLKLDRNCEDAVQELMRVRTQQLMEMGFTKAQAEAAIKQYGSVQQALDSLLAGVVADNSLADVYMSDEEDHSPASPVHTTHNPIPSISQRQEKPASVKMDPTNPEGLTALWVGNVLPEVSESRLKQMFSKHGTVTSVRCLPEKYCAFVNFKNKEAAGNAMHSLQGKECAGQRLLIKFPDNPINNGNIILKKNTSSQKSNSISHPVSSTKHTTDHYHPQQRQEKEGEKTTGPVNGNECYFWRTTGCHYGDSCRHKHIPDHRGIDRKPWQKAKDNS